jgi:hypothetical protein
MKTIVIGQAVKEIRPMTEAEAEAEGWEFNRRHGAPTVIVLANGTLIYASRDDEGNGPGQLFGRDPKGVGIELRGGA